MKPTKRLTARKPAKSHPKPACTEESCAPPPAPEGEDRADTVVMPDPDAQKHRRGLPPGKISHVCGKCGNESAVYVDEPDTYDERARIELFKKRGSSYKPPLCRWCVARLPASERKKIA